MKRKVEYEHYLSIMNRLIVNTEETREFKVPASNITIALIDKFLIYVQQTAPNLPGFANTLTLRFDLMKLTGISANKWRFVAKEHTHFFYRDDISNYNRGTKYYSMFDVAQKILELGIVKLDELYIKYVGDKESSRKKITVSFEEECKQLTFEEIRSLFKYQTYYSTPNGFINAVKKNKVNIAEIKETKKITIDKKRQELLKKFRKQIPKSDMRWEKIKSDDYIDEFYVEKLTK